MHDDAVRPSGGARLLHRVAMPGCAGEPALLTATAGRCASSGNQSAPTGCVVLAGELDAFSSSLLRDPLFDFAAAAGELVIDLRALRFIDSAGVDLLEEVSQHQLDRDGFVRLHEPGFAVRRVLQIVADAAGAASAAAASFSRS